jgi:methionyl-tRNA formyltransferase
VRLYLAGQKAFGAAVFDAVRKAGHEVIQVSAPAWRANGLLPDRLRDAAEKAGIPWLEAGKLRAELLPGGVDLIVCAHSHDFVGRKTRLKARLGAIGYHPSLLPRHRGRDAVRWAVHMGDAVTGGTVYWLTDSVDAGPIAAQEHVFVVPGDAPERLWRDKLAPLGVRLTLRVLEDLAAGRIVKRRQEEEAATWEPSWTRPPLSRPDLDLIGTLPAGFRLEGRA